MPSEPPPFLLVEFFVLLVVDIMVRKALLLSVQVTVNAFVLRQPFGTTTINKLSSTAVPDETTKTVRFFVQPSRSQAKRWQLRWKSMVLTLIL